MGFFETLLKTSPPYTLYNLLAGGIPQVKSSITSSTPPLPVGSAYSDSSGGFSGIGDVIVGKETNKSIQTIAIAAAVLGAIYFFGGKK